MRPATAFLIALSLAACGDRRTFDERYQDTGAKLEEKARALDRNLADEAPADNAGNATTN